MYLKAQNRVGRGYNARRKVRLTFFDVKMQHYIKKATRKHFRGFKTLDNVKPVCLERKFKEPSIKWEV